IFREPDAPPILPVGDSDAVPVVLDEAVPEIELRVGPFVRRVVEPVRNGPPVVLHVEQQHAVAGGGRFGGEDDESGLVLDASICPPQRARQVWNRLCGIEAAHERAGDLDVRTDARGVIRLAGFDLDLLDRAERCAGARQERQTRRERRAYEVQRHRPVPCAREIVTTPTFSSTRKYSSSTDGSIGPYSALTRSRISSMVRLPSAKLSASNPIKRPCWAIRSFIAKFSSFSF